MREATLLDPQNPLVLSTSAWISVFHGRLDEAIARQRRAVDLDPLGAIGHGNLASMLAGAGRFEEALAEEQKALDLNPSYKPGFERSVAAIFIAQGRRGEAMEIVRQWPAGPDRDKGIAMIHHASGRSKDADAALQSLLAQPGAGAALGAAEVHAYRGEVDESFKWLETTLDGLHPNDREMRVQEARLSPFLNVLQDDPRWQQVLAYTD